MIIFMTSMFLLYFLISMIVMFLASILSKKNIMEREKNSPFECGFDPKKTSRIPFSLQFFLLALLFLIFDIEIAFILPMPISSTLISPMTWFLASFIFITILILGLFHEWKQGMLNWSY
uniref:NADH-ubiquinone oxidoreductase chain 3 n=1 Tax=Campodea fragilis TaxID=383857 RepID=Q0ZD12_9HEXA|nr:NADH dehydrogenase subunit 3 [Campodea fragilis]ABF49568.1 NADH dehydrogenase subunit 3 [Campodea fragilis]